MWFKAEVEWRGSGQEKTKCGKGAARVVTLCCSKECLDDRANFLPESIAQEADFRATDLTINSFLEPYHLTPNTHEVSQSKGPTPAAIYAPKMVCPPHESNRLIHPNRVIQRWIYQAGSTVVHWWNEKKKMWISIWLERVTVWAIVRTTVS